MTAPLSRLIPSTDALERTAATAMVLFSSYKLAPFLADGQRRGAGLAFVLLMASVYWLRSALRRRASRDATKAIVSFAELAATVLRHDQVAGEHPGIGCNDFAGRNAAFDMDKAPPLKPAQSRHHAVTKIRTLFISDVHLGTKGCQADLLIEFLRSHDAATVFLVGDIIDGWHLKSNWYWPEAHNNVVQKLLRMAAEGTRLVYVPGNHDEFLRDHVGSTFGGIDVVKHAIHNGADGRDYLVIHGDQFDHVVNHARWLAVVGDWAYRAALSCNAYLNMVRRRLGFPYWSFSAWAKLNVKNAVNYIGRFEELLSAEAHRHDVQGVICGHIHHAVMHDDFGVRYINAGDWVESCSAVIEHYDGRFEILRWVGSQSRPLTIETPPAPPAKVAA
jgi:UDP-2,3-diacylglucosamine pyrophosphatase LpxH